MNNFMLLAGKNAFSREKLAEAWEVFKTQIPIAIWDTLYVTVLATAFALVIGLPLGVLLVVGEKNGIMPLPKWLMTFLNIFVNVLRSVPFVILTIVVIPFTRFIIGTSIGTFASIVPLTVAAFPFIARLVEGSLREVNPNIIEAAQSMGATPMQIITKVILPESVPSLVSNITIALTTILGYNAMSGIVGGGGLGMIAYNYGYLRYRTAILIVAVVILVILVQLFQSIGTKISIKCDKRIKNK